MSKLLEHTGESPSRWLRFCDAAWRIYFPLWSINYAIFAIGTWWAFDELIIALIIGVPLGFIPLIEWRVSLLKRLVAGGAVLAALVFLANLILLSETRGYDNGYEDTLFWLEIFIWGLFPLVMLPLLTSHLRSRATLVSLLALPAVLLAFGVVLSSSDPFFGLQLVALVLAPTGAVLAYNLLSGKKVFGDVAVILYSVGTALTVSFLWLFFKYA